MALVIESTFAADRRELEGKNMANWIADKRYFIDAVGNLIDEDSPERKFLLTPVGRAVDETTARRYGLGPYAVMPDPDPDGDGDGDDEPEPDGDGDEDDEPEVTLAGGRRRTRS